ncbi:GT2 family glycosyltransferase [Desulfobotulus alkaliphilus]|uniref:GT2 family glycosyltransferase n=1 Tax=Desulfobotulus alkaliphilus TaxID=622671 RepID=A0A562R2W4_9BACT|nr:glycosyltransferase family 2 protein [Desulfobotulus alkaliphilus]TWI63387.1 GT2 family glycosyltransferase [Desulfobotulus alkaliphilus]
MLKLKPSISIVIPCYKAEHYIACAIDSALNQDKVDVEVIVVEDGVFDNTKDKIPCLPNVKHIQLEKNMGASGARNIGLAHASSGYVVFLDADDYFQGDLLIGLYQALLESQASLALGRCLSLHEETGKRVMFVPPYKEGELDVLKRWLEGCWGPGTCSILWKVDEIKRIGGWNEDFVFNDDGELVIRALLNGCKVAQSFSGYGVYRKHSSPSVSKRKGFDTFENQKCLEFYVMDRINSDRKFSDLILSLNEFRRINAQNAYKCGYDKIGKDFEKRWEYYGGKLPLSRVGKVPKNIYLILFLLFGMRDSEKIISLLRLYLTMIKTKFFNRK